MSLGAQVSWQAGVSVGAAISDISGDDTQGIDSRTAPYFGLSLVGQPATIIGFETGLYYVSKGASVDDEDVEVDIKPTYLELPLLLRLALPSGESGIRPVIKAGGYMAFQSSCDVEARGGGVSIEVDCDELFDLIGEDEESEIQSVDYGVKAGVAVDIPIGERVVLAPELIYTRGLRDILEVDGESIEGTNSTFQIGIGVRLRL